MPEHNDIETSGSGLLLQVLSSHRDIIVMSVGQKGSLYLPIISSFSLSRHEKKVIVSQNYL